jgi:hypothetical protein
MTFEEQFIAERQEEFNQFVTAKEQEAQAEQARLEQEQSAQAEQEKAQRVQSLKDRIANVRRDSGLEGLEQELKDLEEPAQG